MIRRASAKLENSFVTANFASARAQLSKLECQWALPPNCATGQIMKKQQLFIFSNSLTISQTSTLHNTFYFNNTRTKIQLRSDPVNMQPDKTKCYPQIPITCGLLPAWCWVHLAEAPHWTVGHYHYIIRRGTAGFWGELQGIGMSHLISHHKVAGMSWCSQANIWHRKGKMCWLNEIFIL